MLNLMKRLILLIQATKEGTGYAEFGEEINSPIQATKCGSKGLRKIQHLDMFKQGKFNTWDAFSSKFPSVWKHA